MSRNCAIVPVTATPIIAVSPRLAPITGRMATMIDAASASTRA